jgi:hypothetical protein
MQNIRCVLSNRPGALADMGAALGAARISLEGGGVFGRGATALANFLVADGEAARRALEGAGIDVLGVDEVLMLRIDQETPGQLGAIARRMADAGVNILTQYSDHANQLVLVVDRAEAAALVVAGRIVQRG